MNGDLWRLRGRDVPTTTPRPDAVRAFPELHAVGGFDELIGLPPGRYTFCVYAGNVGREGANNTTLGCLVRDVPGRTPAAGEPQGSLDSFAKLEDLDNVVRGWAWNPATSQPAEVSIRLAIDDRFGTTSAQRWPIPIVADKPRPDVARAVPGAPPNTGFEDEIGGGVSYPDFVCAYVLDHQGGEHLIGCKNRDDYVPAR